MAFSPSFHFSSSLSSLSSSSHYCETQVNPPTNHGKLPGANAVPVRKHHVSRGETRRWTGTGWKSILGISLQRHAVSVVVLRAAQANDEDERDDDDENDVDDDTKGDAEEARRMRKRDKIKDWISGGSADKPMVRPLRVEDGSIVEDEPAPPNVVKAKFDNLFAGMPSLDEILSGNPAEEQLVGDGGGADEDNLPSTKRQRPAQGRGTEEDDSWFHDERQEIMDNYQDILQDMLLQLEEQKEDDPEAVPENAEAMIKSVLKQEMDAEIASAKEKRSRERLDSYTLDKEAEMDEMDISALPADESVQKLMDESEAEYEQQQASRAEIDDFLRYEQEAIAKLSSAEDDEITASDPSVPAPGDDLDRWALERLEDMADSRRNQDDKDGDVMVLDILEENVDDLRKRMEREVSSMGSIQPETMKEWQMYRAITTRLSGDDDDGGDGEDNEQPDDESVLKQLNLWRDYVQTEEGIRKESGLSRGPKLPFEWQEADLRDEADQNAAEDTETKSKSQIRREVNRMSLEAMESLLEKADPARRDQLQKEIDYLKTTFEANDYLDVEEVDEEDDAEDVGPVDTTDLFSTSSFFDEDELDMSSTSASPPSGQQGEARGASVDRAVQETPFFSSGSAREDDEQKPPPATPFFASDDEDSYIDDVAADDSKLGTMEEQKLKAMYRKAGARTTEEQAAIKKQWEEFQEFEEKRRDQYGLSGSSDEMAATDVNYNVSDVVRDGDVDAEKILSSIGPRPTRKKAEESSPLPSPLPLSGGEAKQAESQIEDEQQEQENDEGAPLESSVDEEEVLRSVYRSVSAVGGGRYKDNPEAKAEQQSLFEDYVRKEQELRESLDAIDEEVENEVASSDIPLDDAEYAEDVIESLGPRPTPKRARIVDEGAFSDKGGVLASEDEDSEVIDEKSLRHMNDLEKDTEELPSQDSAEMPEWLRQEKEGTLAGENIDEVFDDDKYEKNQRQLHEYERRRAGEQRQMGIDISDVLGPRAKETDDYADYKFADTYGRQDTGWGVASFEARKNDLLDYTELNVAELNSLMDHKSSVHSTGVSAYMPRINKPFKEFGAIFRLEGVLIDASGLQLEAWTKVAEEYGFKTPSLDDARRAAVTSPEVAAKEVFFWTDDFLLCKQISETHRKYFRNAFEAWMKKEGIVAPQQAVAKSDSRGSLAIGQEFVQEAESEAEVAPSEAEMMEFVTLAWTKTAEAYGLRVPKPESIVRAISLSPDIVVMQAFRWTTDPVDVDQIVASYRRILQSISSGEDGADELTKIVDAKQSSSPSEQENYGASGHTLTKTDLMEIQFLTWKKIAEDYGFVPPDPEEVLAAAAFNDPEVTARDGFGWTTDVSILSNVVQDFHSSVTSLIRERSGIPTQQTSEVPNIVPEATPPVEGPTDDEVFELQVNAWTLAAEKSGFESPSLDEIRLAMKMNAVDAVQRIYKWVDTDGEAAAIASTYEEALKQNSDKYIKKYKVKAPERAKTEPTETRNDGGASQDAVFRAVVDAWTATAKAFSLPVPDEEQIEFALTVGPEDGVMVGFEWTTNATEADLLVAAFKKELEKNRGNWRGNLSSSMRESREESEPEVPSFRAVPGVAKWLESLLDVEMGCGVVSYHDRDQVDVFLKAAGLDDLITADKRVSRNNGHARDGQQMLAAALRLERRPDHCVVFDSNPYASVAAHDVDMRSVAMIDPYPRYELLSADSTASSFEDLTAMNIRRLFGERIFDQPMMDTQKTQPNAGQNDKTKTTYFWDDD